MVAKRRTLIEDVDRVKSRNGIACASSLMKGGFCLYFSETALTSPLPSHCDLTLLLHHKYALVV